MRTTTITIEITAAANASESRIREALLRELRAFLFARDGTSARAVCVTEDAQIVRVTDLQQVP